MEFILGGCANQQPAAMSFLAGTPRCWMLPSRPGTARHICLLCEESRWEKTTRMTLSIFQVALPAVPCLSSRLHPEAISELSGS